MELFKPRNAKNAKAQGIVSYITEQVPFVDGGLTDLIENMLHADPAKRISSARALQLPYFASCRPTDGLFSDPEPEYAMEEDFDWAIRHPSVPSVIRTTIIDWIREACLLANMHIETFSQAVKYLDIYMQQCLYDVGIRQICIIGCACLHLSCIMNEIAICPPEMICKLTCISMFKEVFDPITPQEIMDTTMAIVKTIQHRIPQSDLQNYQIRSANCRDVERIYRNMVDRFK
jgi:hypothetical protein